VVQSENENESEGANLMLVLKPEEVLLFYLRQLFYITPSGFRKTFFKSFATIISPLRGLYLCMFHRE